MTIIESINERDSFFLTNAEYYTDNSVIHMYLTKNSQTQRYGISNIYITTNGNDETILLTEEIYNKVFGRFSIKEMLEMIKSKEILKFMEQFMNEVPLSFDNPYEANYFIFETVDDFIEAMIAQLYYKYKESGIMISFCPNTNITTDEFMFTTELFATQEDDEYYIFERISGQGETFYRIFNSKDGKLSEKVWKETIEYSKALNALNETYKERINEAN